MTTPLIKITTAWMVHSGGSKFYQIFEFKPVNLNGVKPVTMTHWGSIDKLRATEFFRPVNGGEVQVKPGLNLNSRENEKKKRGYETKSTRFSEALVDSAWWVERFGAANAHQLQVAMGVNTAAVHPSDDVDTSYMGKTSPTPEPDVRPDSWGSW